MGAERLTVKAHGGQIELLEVSKDYHVGCNRPTQFVAAQRELFEICEGREQLECLGKRRSCAQHSILSVATTAQTGC